MKTRTILAKILAVLFTMAVFSVTGYAGPIGSPAVQAFDRLKGLVGDWQAETPMGKIHLKYELISGGNVLLERLDAPSVHDKPMITAYYVEDDKLELTHYCQLGNQPHMVARQINLGTGEIDFDFAGAANLASADAQHMHSAKVRLIDADHFNSDWTLFENAKAKTTVAAQYARVK